MSSTNPYAAPDVSESVEPKRAPVDEVPAGTGKEILAWVNSDPERARRALDAELDGNKRKTLVKDLESIIDG